MADQTLTLGPVLLTGGNGFIAYHIIAKILQAEPRCQIHAMDVDTSRNRHATVQYHRCDIASAGEVDRVFDAARPRTVFHLASPEFSDLPPSAYHDIIVEGSRHLLAAAKRLGTVRAFVYTSSSSVIHDNVTDLVNASENWPILRPPQQRRVYSLAKADSEEEVIAANRQGDGGMLTAATRPSLAFGERDTNSFYKMVGVAQQGKSKFQMGAGDNLFDFMYVGNLADAHVLLAQKLLQAWGKPAPSEPSERVDGECFNFSNADPWAFWGFQRAVSAAIGKPVAANEIVTIPKPVGLFMAYISEWITWAISAGKRKPAMNVEGIRFSTLTRTLNVEKAQRVLGFEPKVSVQEGIDRSVRFYLEEREGDVKTK